MSRYAAPATKSRTPTSPNTAPATQNESKHWSAWHMKRHLHCAEQAKSPSNLTNEILKLKISAETPCFLQLKDDSRIIRGHSEQKIVISHPLLRRPYPSDLGDDFVFKKTHFALRLSPKMSPNAAPATKSHTPTSLNTPPAQKTHTPPSPLTAPARKNAIYSSLRLYSLLASFLSWHLFSLHIYSLLASFLSWHLFSLGIYSLYTSIL